MLKNFVSALVSPVLFAVICGPTLLSAPARANPWTDPQLANPQLAQTQLAKTSEMPASPAVRGTIESIDAAQRTVSVKTSDGQTLTYFYQPGALADLTPGMSVLVMPKQAVTGVITDRFKNYLTVKLDNSASTSTTSGSTIVHIPQQPAYFTQFGVGDRIVLWSSGTVVIRNANQIEELMSSAAYSGYISQGEMVAYTARTIALETTSTSTVREVPLTPRPVAAPMGSGPTQAVPALW
jgi:hypothetical protein